LNEPNIIEILQKAVHEVFSNCFSYQTKKERILINSLKRKSEELEKIDNKMGSIICGIRLEECGKNIVPKSLKTKITKLQESGSNLSGEINLKQNFEEIRMSVNNILNEKKIGSVIFISTEQYLSLVLSNPCSHYHNINIQNKTYHTSCVGFKVTIDVDCRVCETIDSFSNQSEGVNFSHLIAAATLAGDLNHCVMQTALAITDITTQICKQSYHQYQSQDVSYHYIKSK
ncbi:8427_t:CDS:2, partial [Funneliformis geosporum]